MTSCCRPTKSFLPDEELPPPELAAQASGRYRQRQPNRHDGRNQIR
jgi:hypothetical protein